MSLELTWGSLRSALTPLCPSSDPMPRIGQARTTAVAPTIRTKYQPQAGRRIKIMQVDLTSLDTTTYSGYHAFIGNIFEDGTQEGKEFLCHFDATVRNAFDRRVPRARLINALARRLHAWEEHGTCSAINSHPDDDDEKEEESMADRVALHIVIARSITSSRGEVILSVTFTPNAPSSHGDECELGSAMKEMQVMFTAVGLNRIGHDMPTSEMLAWTQPASFARQLLVLSTLLQAGGWTVTFDDNLAGFKEQPLVS